jgi:hypothetical protein
MPSWGSADPMIRAAQAMLGGAWAFANDIVVPAVCSR